MKRSFKFIMANILVLTLAMLGTAWAAKSADEKKLDKETAAIDKTAGKTGGSTVVTDRLEKEFNVTADQITALRDKGLGYGEISIVFSLAGKLPGGITDANIAEITGMRTGPPVMGWGEIANKLGFKLGPTVSEVMKVNKEAERDMKTEKSEMGREGHGEGHGEMNEHGGMGAGGMSHGGRGY